MMNVVDWLSTWSNLGPIVGVVVSIGGLGFAIYQIMQTKQSANAAELSAKAAEQAVIATRDRLGANVTINDLTRASQQLQQVKELHLDGQWRRALDRYHDISVILANIRSQHPSLNDQQQTTIQSAIRELATLEQVVTAAIREGAEPENLESFDLIILSAQSMLDELVSQLRQAI